MTTKLVNISSKYHDSTKMVRRIDFTFTMVGENKPIVSDVERYEDELEPFLEVFRSFNAHYSFDSNAWMARSNVRVYIAETSAKELINYFAPNYGSVGFWSENMDSYMFLMHPYDVRKPVKRTIKDRDLARSNRAMFSEEGFPPEIKVVFEHWNQNYGIPIIKLFDDILQIRRNHGELPSHLYLYRMKKEDESVALTFLLSEDQHPKTYFFRLPTGMRKMIHARYTPHAEARQIIGASIKAGWQ